MALQAAMTNANQSRKEVNYYARAWIRSIFDSHKLWDGSVVVHDLGTQLYKLDADGRIPASRPDHRRGRVD